MKLVSWNVNGLRSCLTKGFLEYVKQEDPDIVCLQETKLQPEQAVFELEGYHRYFHSADKKGYSGTAVLTKEEPLSVVYGFGDDVHRHEGRVITAEYPEFYLVCCYTPNSQDGLKRLDYRMQWEDDLRAYLLELDGKKPVIYCGDLNVAHREIDLKNPKSNQQNAGFTILDEELGAEQYGIAFRSGDQELCDTVQAAVQKLVDNGTYAKIAEKYPDIVNNLLFLSK